MARGFGQYALPLSGAPGPRTAGGGGSPQAIIAHHTSGRGTPQSIVNYWKSERPGIGSQYIIDRDGNVIDTRTLGYNATSHIREGQGPEGRGLSNKNTVGYEIIAKDDADITPAQREAFKAHTEKNYPDVPVKGHGQVNPHKEEEEGATAVKDVAASREAAAKVADVSRGAGEAGSKTALAANQYALPGRETMTAEAAKPPTGQYALAQDPMTAGNAPSRGGFSYPSRATPEVRAAIENVANQIGVHPDAIAGLIHTESRFSPLASTGSYRGMTQIGPETFREAGGKLGGMTWDEFQKASPAQQVTAYGDWLQHYGFSDKAQAAGVNLANMTPAQQAAYLQGFQFGPNAIAWQSQYGQGKDTMRVTQSKQADVLGDTSMKQMTAYYDKLMGGQPKETQIAKAPTTDIAKGFQTAAAGSSGGGIGSDAARAPEKQFALPASPGKLGTGLTEAAKAFTPDDKAPKATTPLGAAGLALGALGDARMDRRMADIKASPLVGTPPEAMPGPATPTAPGPPAAKTADLTGGPLGPPPGFQPPTTEKAAPLPPPGPLVPKINPPPVNEAANAKLAEAFGGLAPSLKDTTVANLFGDTPNATGFGATMPTAPGTKLAGAFSSPAPAPPPAPQDINYANLFGETPNATGSGSILPPAPTPPPTVQFNTANALSPFGPSTGMFDTSFSLPASPTPMASLYGETPNATGSGSYMIDALNQRAAAVANAPQAQGSQLEVAPETPAQGSGGGSAGSGTDFADTSPRSGFGGVIVPPVQTPLDFSAIQAGINAPVNPLAGVNMSSPATWFMGS